MVYSEVRAEARQLLTGKWGKGALVWLVYMAIVGVMGAIPFIGELGALLVGGPFLIAICSIFLKLYRHEDFVIDELFNGFKDFTRNFVAYLLVALYTMLWTLLLIVPGIIAAISYSQVFYLMAEDPNLQASDAITMSKNMMNGHKTDYFLLMLSFIGWALLCALTFGIGYLWLGSYVEMTKAIFYRRLRGDSGAFQPTA